MAVHAVEVGSRKIVKFLSAVIAALLALPGLMLAQAQRLSGEWLQLTPTDPKAGIRNSDPKVGITTVTEAGATVSIERRIRARSRHDSLASVNALEASRRDMNLHVAVSLEDRKLWVIVGQDTVMTAPVAIGTGETLVFGEKAWTFDTPRGVRTIRDKDSDPHWIPPEWHYAETAKEYDLRLGHLSLTKSTKISGGRKIMFKDGEAGVFHPDSGFALLPLDEEIVFDSTLFIPPVGSKNRAVQGELGKYKLDTGGGVLLHGTPHQNSIGKAATHGCMRLRDEDIEWLYQFVPVGTKIYIY
ncbi:MAG TPA: L,D-transpeptidase [Gemmatimonadaceae bacterium]|nr:L,D-transpeptidase [Gemmatimonadaceae bacterium]